MQAGAQSLSLPALQVPVVVDPYLGRTLRPHQVQGVSWMYECTMGLRQAGRSGAILADEMGAPPLLLAIRLLICCVQVHSVALRVVIAGSLQCRVVAAWSPAFVVTPHCSFS